MFITGSGHQRQEAYWVSQKKKLQENVSIINFLRVISFAVSDELLTTIFRLNDRDYKNVPPPDYICMVNGFLIP